QAEDGIRDFHETGVQTCALPISTKNGIFMTVSLQERTCITSFLPPNCSSSSGNTSVPSKACPHNPCNCSQNSCAPFFSCEKIKLLIEKRKMVKRYFTGFNFKD